ncbi:MAG: response regulator [Gammaproteobacteria bacterium]|nr:response regulator [Gammaproteobacteria bacterium]MBU0786044.1 response regulator [Gammaproteobacteria bacterium]MBU0814367.1 response regulator [Gammaproteobacteria bacterium]MBU1786788.1 response regulator [Gammaproteobacteria bacterium]
MFIEGRNDRILIIDDDPTILLLLDMMLRAEGYKNIELLEDSRQARNIYRSQPADLILLDINMPHLSGFEVMEQLTGLEDPLLAPILVLTADHGRESLLQSFASGARDYISKPFDRLELVARVENLLAVQRGRRAIYEQKTLLQELVMLRTNELLESNQQLQAKVSALKNAEAAMSLAREDLRELVGHQETIREDERKRIAREIHDELGSLLTGIKACLSVMGEHGGRTGKTTQQLLDDATGLANTAIDTVRRVITDLRPSVLDHLGLWSGLEWYVSQTAARTGLACDFQVDESTSSLEINPECSTMLFRIVQEALTNVVRHAEASHVTVHATQRDGNVVIEVADDGKGIAAERLQSRRSFGLQGMRERAQYFGGQFSIQPGKECGTVVLVQCPLQKTNG